MFSSFLIKSLVVSSFLYTLLAVSAMTSFISTVDGAENKNPSAPVEIIAAIIKLQELNPGYDGKYIYNSKRKSLSIRSQKVGNVSPLRELELNRLSLSGCGIDNQSLKGLKGMKLKCLNLSRTGVTDVSPLNNIRGLKSIRLSGCKIRKSLACLKRMSLSMLDLGKTDLRQSDLHIIAELPVQWLSLSHTGIADLTPLGRMKTLKVLYLSGTAINDLAPLRNVPLGYLAADHTGIKDISVLENKNMWILGISGTKVKSLEPLRGQKKVKRLFINDTLIEDITPIKGMPLTHLGLDPGKITKGLELIPRISPLQWIYVSENGKLKRYGKNGFMDKFSKVNK